MTLSRTSCILSGVVLFLLVCTVGMLTFILHGEREEEEEERTTLTPSPHTHTPAYPGGDASPWKDPRLPRYVIPSHYDLLLHPDMEQDTFTGTVNVTVRLEHPTRFLLLHSHRLTVRQVRLFDVRHKEVSVEMHFPYRPNQYHVVRMEHLLPVGQYHIFMDFKGTLNGSVVGFYKSQYRTIRNETRFLATSKFQPTYARRAFPCFDEPGFKATFTVSLVHDLAHTALSNMPPEVTQHIPGTSLYVTKFQKSVPMVTYLACFIVSDFQYREGVTASGKAFRVYSAPDLVNSTEYALDIGVRALNYFEEFFGTEFPLPKQDMVAVPDFASGAMEHWGIISFRETNLLFNPAKGSPQNKHRIAEVIAHEMAHMWFGNLVTMEWWEDLWLNEGFASYVKYKGLEHLHPEWGTIERFCSVDLQPVMDMDSWSSSHPIVQKVAHPDQITEIFDQISYKKGASVLRMLEHFVGSENFRIGISNYLKKHAFKNAKTADLWKELSEVCGPQGNRSISSIMQTWTEQMGFPYVTVARRSPSVFVARQTRFLRGEKTNSSFDRTWSIPLSYITGGGKTGIVWIHDKEDVEFSVPLSNSSEWVKFNVNQTGYYLVQYPPEEWQTLTTLLLEHPEALSPSDRSNLLYDSFLLSAAGLLELETFLNLSTYLRKENALPPWETAFIALKRIADLTEDDADLGSLVQSYIKDLTDNLYKKLGFKISNDIQENFLTTAVVKLACGARNTECLSQATHLFENWTKGQEELPAQFRILVLRYGLELGEDVESWDRMWELYVKELSPALKKDYLEILGRTRQPLLIARYLEYIMDERKVRRQDCFFVLTIISKNPVGRNLVWKFLRDRWPDFVERYTLNDRYLGNLVKTISSQFHSSRRLEEIRVFFSRYPEAGAGARARLQALEVVQDNVRLANSYATPLEQWVPTKGLSAPWYHHRLPPQVVPLHYDLLLHPQLESDRFTGSVSILLLLKSPSRHFLVHSNNINVTKSEALMTDDSSNTSFVIDLENRFFYEENNYLVLTATSTLSPGNYTLYFEFEGPFTLSLKGLYKSSYIDSSSGKTSPLAVTNLEPIETRTIFPCFDEPGFRSTFTVNVLHDDRHFALSNSRVESTSNATDGLLLTRFERTLPMPTYLLCVVVCDYMHRETITENGVQLRVYAPRHFENKTHYALDIGSKALTWFEKYFDIPFPLKKLDLISIPDLLSDGMENWGLVTFDEVSLLAENVSSVPTRIQVTTLIAHELAHMWFGDLVTMKWWNDLWLNEGFSTYMSMKIMGQVEPDLDVEGDEQTLLLLGAMREDCGPHSHPIVQPVVEPSMEIFDDVTYSKGSTVLRMLENYMTEDFRQGVTNYLKKHAFQNTVTKDLWLELTAASKQGLDVGHLMDTWTGQSNFPYLTVEKGSEAGRWLIQQHRFLSDPETEGSVAGDSPYNYTWLIPLTYRTSESNITNNILLNTSEKVEIDVPPSKWLKFNVNFTGYYLVNYDREMWDNLTHALQTDPTVFSPADRLNLVVDSFWLAAAGHLDFEVPLTLIQSYLSREEYHAVWTEVLQQFTHIGTFYRGDKETEELLQEFVRSLSKPLYEKYQWSNNGSVSQKKLRRIIIKSACGNGDQECLQAASTLFREWINGTEPDPELQESVCEFGLRTHDDLQSWEFAWREYLSEEDPNTKQALQTALATIRNSSILERLLKFAENESLVRKHDYLRVIDLVSQNPKGFNSATRLILKNWTKLVKLYDVHQVSALSKEVLGRYNTEKDLEKVRDLYRKRVKGTEGRQTRTQTLSTIRENIHWMRIHRSRLRDWMQANVYMPWRLSRLPRHAAPLRYEISLRPDLTSTTFDGNVLIEFNMTQSADFFVLHAAQTLRVTGVEVADDSGVVHPHSAIFLHQRNEYVVVRFEKPLTEGRYVFRAAFSGTFSPDGRGLGKYQYVHRGTGQTRFLLATEFESTYARRVFPCFDEPDRKARFRLTVVHDKIHDAVSNMPVETEEILYDGSVKTIFMETPQMSTFLLFCAVTDFDYLQSYHKGKPIRVYASPDRIKEAEYGLNLTVNLLGKLEDYFGIPYALPKLDSVVIPEYAEPAMEHWGAIAYSPKHFLTGEHLTESRRVVMVDRVVAHELVHQWFGNLVTMSWWDALWLYEGASSLIMNLPLLHSHPEVEEVDIRKVTRVMCADSHTATYPIRRDVITQQDIAETFDAISYEKGSSVLKMLQHTLKDDFQTGLSNYLKKYEYENAEAEDLWSELTSASKKGINVSSLMSGWTTMAGFPYVELRRDGDTVTAEQRRFVMGMSEGEVEQLAASSKHEDRFVWKIPLTYKNLKTAEENTLWLNDKQGSFQIAAARDDVVKFNPGFVGFYVVKYDSRDWARIGQRLLRSHEDLSLHDRYNVLHDAFLLAEADRLVYDIPLELSRYLKAEREALPWNLFRDHFVHFEERLQPGSQADLLLRAYVVNLTSSLYDEYVVPATRFDKSAFKKWKSSSLGCSYTVPDLDFLSVLIDLSCRSGSKKCLEAMKDELRLWISGQSVKANLHLVLDIALSDSSDAALWEQIRIQLTERESDPDQRKLLAEALVSFGDAGLVQKTLDVMFSDSNIDPEIARFMFLEMVQRPGSVFALWKRVTEQWDILLPRLNVTDNLSTWIAPFCQVFKTRELFEEFIRFVRRLPEPGEFLVESCIRDMQDSMDWLDGHEETLLTWLMWNVR